MKIQALLKERILLLDGAMGTMIQRYGLKEEDYRGARFADVAHLQKGNNDLLSLTQPHIIEEIHRAYLEAGADIIETNTFNATRISMADYGMEMQVAEINRAAAQIAKRAAQSFTDRNPRKPRFVAGSIGPTNKTASMSPDVSSPMYRAVTFDDLKCAYIEQITALIEGGVDLLLIETIFDTLNAKAAIFAAEDVFCAIGRRLPVMLSVTVTDKAGRTLSGQTLSAFLTSVMHTDLMAVGLNCSFGAADLKPYLKELSRIAPYYVSVYPNAGLPNALGTYDETPESMATQVREFVEEGWVNILGGCCGTTPAHIEALSALIEGVSPRVPAVSSRLLRLSGLEQLEVSPAINFVNIGERCNVAGSRKFLRLIKEEKYEEALEIARKQVEDGAQVLDINMDDGLLDGEREMTRFLNLLASEPDIAGVPLMIDSSKWSVIEAGLKCTQGKAIVNSISLKEGETVFLAHARQIRRYGAAVVVMAFDEEGQATTYERKIAICERAYHLLVNQGFPAEDIIFDPNVLTIATGIDEHKRYAIDFIRTIKWIKAHLPYAKVSGGVSNLSFAFRGNDYVREAMHAVFLYYAIAEGMDMGIVNPSQAITYEDIAPELLKKIEDVLFDRTDTATDELLEYARVTCSTAKEESGVQKEIWRNSTVEERLSYALVKGISEYLEEDIAEALRSYPKGIDVIDKPLMAGMNRVGELFGSGKMFLPQVVKAARTMKKAVTILEPILEEEKKASAGKKAGKILIATVKGDVHDIGKNIVGIILACNNYEVIDLGVMVSAERIIEAIQREQPDLVGLSGLITPSLEEMTVVAKELAKSGLTLPLLIGGATTSKQHTALKIAPQYETGTVVYVKDASQIPAIAAKLLHKQDRVAYIQSVKEEYAALRAAVEQKDRPALLPLAEAREKSYRITWEQYTPVKPKTIGRKVLEHISIAEIVPFINWKFFFHTWSLSAKFHSVTKIDLSCMGCRNSWLAMWKEGEQEQAETALKLWEETQHLLKSLIASGISHIKAVFSIEEAYSVADDIYIGGQKYPLLRMQQVAGMEGVTFCMADFVAPKASEVIDYAGVFAVTAGAEDMYIRDVFGGVSDGYHTLLLKSLLDRLAEATTEWLHREIRTRYWGYAAEEQLTIEDLFALRYVGIRPAVGYPSLPDQSIGFSLHTSLQSEEIGISLTENGVMYPNASVSGFILANPSARYFAIGELGDDQVEEYAGRRGVPKEELRKFLMANRKFSK